MIDNQKITTTSQTQNERILRAQERFWPIDALELAAQLVEI